MVVEIHSSVKKVAEFMQRNIEASELVPVAEALSLIAPALWGHYDSGSIIPLTLEEPEINNSAYIIREGDPDYLSLDKMRQTAPATPVISV